MDSQISGFQVVPLEYWGQEVFTNSQLGVMYGCSRYTIAKAYQRHALDFQHGEDFFLLKGEDLREFKDNVKIHKSSGDSHITRFIGVELCHTRSIYLWTKSGALKIAKFLTTDNAKLYYTEHVIKKNYSQEDEREETKVTSSKFEALMELIRLTTDEELRNKLIREAAQIILGKEL